MNRGADIWNSSVRSFPLVRICRTRSGSWNGSPLRNRSLINEKIAVLSPIPSASVTKAMKVNAGDSRSLRKAKRRSFMQVLFGAQRLNWIDQCGAAGGQQARKERDGREQNGRAAEQHGVMGRHFKELRRKQSPEREGGHDANRESDHNRPHSLIDDQMQDVAGLRAERHPNSDLTGALFNAVSHSSVHSNCPASPGN